MIVECPNCNKKFKVNEKLIPKNGRTLKCSVCEHVWHYNITLTNNTKNQKISEEKINKSDTRVLQNQRKDNDIIENINDDDISNISKKIISKKKIEVAEAKTENIKTNYEKEIKLKMIFVYFIILIISLAGLIFVLDTFKYSLSNVFPDIVPFFDSFYETILDLKLFFKDLTN